MMLKETQRDADHSEDDSLRMLTARTLGEKTKTPQVLLLVITKTNPVYGRTFEISCQLGHGGKELGQIYLHLFSPGLYETYL
jgi:hypothetical protein